MSGRGGKARKKPSSRSARAGLQFPVGRMHRRLKSSTHHLRIGSGAPVYLAACIEYLTAEILELAGNAARDNKKLRIIPRHIQLAIGNDEELHKLLSDVTIASGGVLPHVHTELLSKKAKGGGASVAAAAAPKKSKVRVSRVGKSTPAKSNFSKKSGSSTKASKNSEVTILSEKQLFLGQKLIVTKGDITKISTDGIVHPTSSNFSHAGMIGGALSSAGGKQYMDGVAKVEQETGSLPVAGVTGSPAANLSAQEVIHVHSPSWGSTDCQGNLEKAVRNILDYADKKGMKSVAIPSIGSGSNNFPKLTAAQIILRSIAKYFVGVMSSSLKEVYFVLWDEESINIYTSELNKLDVSG
ncbi:Core histone macro-H2A.1 [Trichoplax sp. H2]|nr:Core histone macro-H2A.1 [Trichoplax sp. H2]|eukprot:RDD46936.1 Core histone macro-H2A.1 [Trichoplax sp. H2]